MTMPESVQTNPASSVSLQWSQVDFASARLHVTRLKHGLPSVHPLSGDELRALRALHRSGSGDGFVFMSERGTPLAPATVRDIVARAGDLAGLAALGLPCHPHMLRHACGYALANRGHDTRAIQAYLGHRNITHTVRYTELSPERFKDFWRE
jgi:type 1 fimbriae regulatory protein FimB/type 1 fimbriae regulatory protein FimE